MLELNGIVKKIEKTEITNVDLVYFEVDTETEMTLEIVKRINPFKESEPITVIFNTQPSSKENPKLILKGYLYSISKNSENNKISISVGGLQLKIKTSKDYDEFKVRKELFISFF
ncbi:MAG: DNA-directed RNA polymerase subunit G [Candidatus Helarchaeota archaeon]